MKPAQGKVIAKFAGVCVYMMGKIIWNVGICRWGLGMGMYSECVLHMYYGKEFLCINVYVNMKAVFTCAHVVCVCGCVRAYVRVEYACMWMCNGVLMTGKENGHTPGKHSDAGNP